jgi:hypothetical protein
METALFKYRLKQESLPRVREWVDYFNKNREEIIVLLEKEDISIEAAFLESTDDGDFMYYFVRTENLKRAQEIFIASTNRHDSFHKEFMREVVQSSVRLDGLIEVSQVSTANRACRGGNG